MAAVGEGDSRWVVEHREDGRNVNSWHWDQLDVSNKTEVRRKKGGVSAEGIGQCCGTDCHPCEACPGMVGGEGG